MKNSTMLTATSEYAIRALTHLARLPEGETMLGRDLAEKADIPANYLSKIMWALGNSGIIHAARGSGGGYRLNRKAQDIRLFEIVELFDRERANHACFLGGRECDQANPCAAHDAWRGVCDAYLNFLHTTTLVDVSQLRRSNAPKL